MNYLGEYLFKQTNYCIMNENNVYNCFIDIVSSLEEPQVKIIVSSIKIHIGLTFYNKLKQYVYKKLPKSNILLYFD